MKYTAYHFAAADLIGVTIACFLGLSFFLLLGWATVRLFSFGVDLAQAFSEPESDASFEDSPDLSETGIACEIAKLPPGSQLVEVDTAGMLTPPAHVYVHEYVWTGSEIKFVRRVPLHEFDFLIPGSAMHAASHPEALAAREDFLKAHRPLTPADQVSL